jgi:ATP-dependent DNA ligase
VIDAEAVAFDLETKKLLPFQDLSRRKRKDVRTEDITVRVHLFAFDLLYLNGEVSLSPRRQVPDIKAECLVRSRYYRKSW